MSRYPAARYLGSAHDPEQFLPDAGAEVAFVGRSNSGKSSAINAIVGRRQLARISRTPGRTQLVNFFGLGPDRRLVDLPGYGFARVPPPIQAHWRGLMDAYFARRRSLAGLFLVVDVRRGLGEGDRRMLEWAAAIDCPVHVLLTKSDKIAARAGRSMLAAVSDEAPAGLTVQLFSAQNGLGVAEAQQRMDAMLGSK